MREGFPSRIWIKVADSSQWDLIKDIDFRKYGLDLSTDDLKNSGMLEYLKTENDDWCNPCEKVEELFCELHENFNHELKNNIIFLADSENDNSVHHYFFRYFNNKLEKKRTGSFSYLKYVPINQQAQWELNFDTKKFLKKAFEYTETDEGIELDKCLVDWEIMLLPANFGRKKITTVKESCFSGRQIKRILILDNIEKIETRAFENCTALQSVLFGCEQYSKLNDLEAFTFNGCASLKVLVLPRGLMNLRPGSLFGFPLQTLFIPNTIHDLDVNVFSCEGKSMVSDDLDILISYNYEYVDNLLNWNGNIKFSIVFEDVPDIFIPREWYNRLIYNPDLFLNRNEYRYGYQLENQLYYSHEKRKYEPERVPKEPDSVFINSIRENKSLIDIPETINDIPVYRIMLDMFEHFSLGTPDYRQPWNEIPKKIHLPKTVKYVENGVINLSDISVDLDNPYLEEKENLLFTKKDGALITAAPGTKDEIFIDDYIKEIRKNSLIYLTNIKKIKIGKNVSSIEDGAFNKCAGLERIEVDLENPYFMSADGILYDKSQTILVKIPQNKVIEEYVFPDSVQYYFDSAFGENINLKKIKLNGTITIKETKILAGCKNIEEVIIPEDNNEDALYDLSEDAKILYKYTGMSKRIIIPEGVEQIGMYAFTKKNMEEIEFPKSLKSIDSMAFSYCKNLKKIDLPENVILLGQGVFWQCPSLEYVRMPANLVILDRYYSYYSKVGVFADSPLKSVEVYGRYDISVRSKWNRYQSYNGSGIHEYKPMAAFKINDFSDFKNFLGFPASFGFPAKNFYAPEVPYNEIPEELQQRALFTYIRAFMTGKDIPETCQESYFAAMSKKKISEDILRDPLLIGFFLKQKLLNLERTMNLIQKASDLNLQETEAMLLTYKEQQFSKEDMEKHESSLERKHQNELKKSFGPKAEKKETIKNPWQTDKHGDITDYVGEDSSIRFPVKVDGKKVKSMSRVNFNAVSKMSDVIEKAIIPEGYDRIGAKMFRGCKKLNTVKLPYSLWNIDEYAFQDCTALESVLLPPNAELSKWTFKGCSNLKDVYILNDKGRFSGNAAFRDCPNAIIHIKEPEKFKRTFAGCKVVALTEDSVMNKEKEIELFAPYIKKYFENKISFKNVNTCPDGSLVYICIKTDESNTLNAEVFYKGNLVAKSSLLKDKHIFECMAHHYERYKDEYEIHAVQKNEKFKLSVKLHKKEQIK